MRFIGRHRTLASPAAFDGKAPLSNSEGPVLDPIVSIRQTVLLQPNEAVRIDIVTGVAESRAGVEALTEKYSDPSLADRVFDLAWTHGHILLQQLSASEADAQVYGRLAGSIIYASALRRAKASILGRNRQGQSGLWGYGISGDVPIVLVRIRDHERIALVRASGAGPCLLAIEGARGRSGDLERRRLGLSANVAGRHRRSCRRQSRSVAGRSARRRFHSPRRADVG